MPKTSKRAIQAPPTDSLDYGRKRSQWRDVPHRLTRNKLAMLGLVIVLVLVLAAVLWRAGFPAGFHSVHCIRPGGGRDHRCVRRLFRRSL